MDNTQTERLRNAGASFCFGRHALAGGAPEWEAKRLAVPHAEARIVALPSGGALHVDGPAGAVPVLFLHGLGGGVWSWKAQRALLTSTHRTFFWEARGHGSAARVEDAGLADYYADAHEAVAKVLEDGQKPAFIVGHSMGGFLAMALATEVAAAVRGLVLIDPVSMTGDDGFSRAWPFTGLLRPFAAPLFGSIKRNGSMANAVSRWMFARCFEDRERMEAAWPDQQSQVPFEYPRMLRELLTGPAGFPLRDYSREITDPTMMLDAAKGSSGPRFPRLIQTFRERLGDDFTYEAIPGGHYLQLDRPDVVNDRLLRFLEASMQ